MITKGNNKYILKSKDGRKILGKYPSKKQAMDREKQIQFFKAIADRKGKK